MSTRIFKGYRGRDAHNRAWEASRTSNCSPWAIELLDGSMAGVGETILASDGTRDRLLWGAYGSSCWASDAMAQGLLSPF